MKKKYEKFKNMFSVSSGCTLVDYIFLRLFDVYVLKYRIRINDLECLYKQSQFKNYGLLLN